MYNIMDQRYICFITHVWINKQEKDIDRDFPNKLISDCHIVLQCMSFKVFSEQAYTLT